MPKLRKEEPKAIMTFEISTLNTLLRYAMCTTISKSSIVNLSRLVNVLDLRAYAYSPDIVARLKAINYVTEARVKFGMNDPDVIRTYVINTYPDGKEVLDDCEPLVLDTLGFNECQSLTNIISERLQFLYIFTYKDQIIESLNRFGRGGFETYATAIEELREQLQKLIKELSICGVNRTNVIRRLNLAADNYYDLVDNIVTKAKMPTASLQTGIRALNGILSPAFQAGRLYLILGLTGRFKSGTLLNIADQLTKYNPHIKPVEDGMRKTVLFITNENSIDETYIRMLDMYTPGDADIMNMSTEQVIKYIKENGGYRFTDTDGITIEFRYYRNMEMSTADLYTIIDELADEGYKVIACILDYIARVRSMDGNMEERFRLANVAKELKSCATYFGIPIITAQQVNREGNGIIDAAMRDNKADLAKFLGTTAVAESYGLIYEADWVALVNLEKRKSDNKWFLTFNRLKIRGKQDPFAVTYFNHPFSDEKRIRLQPDVDMPQSISVVSLASDLESITQDDAYSNNVNRKYAQPSSPYSNQYGSVENFSKKTVNARRNMDLDGLVNMASG